MVVGDATHEEDAADDSCELVPVEKSLTLLVLLRSP